MPIRYSGGPGSVGGPPGVTTGPGRRMDPFPGSAPITPGPSQRVSIDPIARGPMPSQAEVKFKATPGRHGRLGNLGKFAFPSKGRTR